ncbi:O-antigen ligase family protein [Dokdonia sp. Hel_I_53]|uniref:O-antigen ligase family protein n=1 Tax=Dokdonia sp. Hel_I_53 TaxID=1566287 RepID=UPI00119A4B66|nr:O-antigen ligase family protein [Dokdonia sp. Hel_I_53]TVZ52666.1 O-antigen ligase-like membrane protein [Dokdonia sp. Hel_I_53]
METEKEKHSVTFLRYALALVFASVVLPTNLKSIAIGVFAVAVIFNVSQRRLTFNKQTGYAGIFYVLIALTFFYSNNQEYALRKLSTLLPLLIFPVLFSLLNTGEVRQLKKWRRPLLLTYIITVFLFNLIPFVWLWITHYSFEELIIHYTTVVRVDFGKYSIHPIYLSMHNGLTILFSFFLIVRKLPKGLIYSLLAVDAVLLLFLLLFAKKGPLLALLLMLGLTLIFHRKNKLFKPYLLITIVLIGLTIVIPKTRNKFIELFSIENVDTGAINSTNIRYSIYTTTINLIQKAPVFGYGIGDYREVLTSQFQKDGNEMLYEANYNAHNQYLSFLLIGGVVLLITFLIYLFITGVLAIRYDNQLLILTLIFYSIVMFTENILERESGVLYFALFLSYFGLFNAKEV